MISAKQALLARTMLEMSQQDIATALGWAHQSVSKIENGTVNPPASRLQELQTFFENAGVEFLDGDGIRQRQTPIQRYNGVAGFRAFMFDVYDVVKEMGGNVCVYNVDERNWLKWLGDDLAKELRIKMATLKNFRSKILLKEGDRLFTATDYAEYRWFPAQKFKEKSFYAYGDKLALVNFLPHDVRVLVLKESEFTDGFRTLFDIAWEKEARIPSKEE